MAKKKPIISYFANYDPTLNMERWSHRLTDINVIITKVLTDKFIKFAVDNKNKIFIHYVCNGLGGTVLEPNIPNLKYSFFALKALIEAGFPQKQILVIVKPIIQNENGLKSIKLMMQLFSKFKELRLRYVRFELLKYYKDKNHNQYMIANRNIVKRLALNPQTQKIYNDYLKHDSSFYRQYKQLIHDYRAIITVDDEKEFIIGTRELKPFGYINNYINELNLPDKLVKYNNQRKDKPLNVNMLSNPKGIRCLNRCVLCPYQ